MVRFEFAICGTILLGSAVYAKDGPGLKPDTAKPLVVDYSQPKITVRAFVRALEESSAKQVKACSTSRSKKYTVLCDAVIDFMLAEYEFQKKACERFGSDPLWYNWLAVLKKEVDADHISFTGDRAEIQLGAGNSLSLEKEGIAWKVVLFDFGNILDKSSPTAILALAREMREQANCLKMLCGQITRDKFKTGDELKQAMETNLGPRSRLK